MNEPVLSGRSIKHGYSSIDVLSGVDVNIFAGEIVGLLGKSGCGKSTLLGILSGLRHPDSGTIIMNNKDIYTDSNTTLSVRKQTGIVFQLFNLLPELTVKENVVFASRLRIGRITSEDDIRTLLQEMDILHLEGRYPSELSIGERQRAAIARAVIGNPVMIFADEPTGSIDTENKAKVLKLFGNIRRRNIPVFMTSHDHDTLNICDRIYELKNGQCQEVR